MLADRLYEAVLRTTYRILPNLMSELSWQPRKEGEGNTMAGSILCHGLHLRGGFRFEQVDGLLLFRIQSICLRRNLKKGRVHMGRALLSVEVHDVLDSDIQRINLSDCWECGGHRSEEVRKVCRVEKLPNFDFWTSWTSWAIC